MSKLIPEPETALRLPIGAFSPLWMMFAGAAMTGAAVFWARNWYRATNLEALTSLHASEPDVVVKEALILAEPMVEAVEEMAEVAAEVVEDAAEAAIEAAPEVAEATVAAPADDLTRLSGIGPKLAVALAERGVTRFADIAAWTEDDIARFDKDLKLMGRVGREAWLAQARRFSEAATH